MIIVRSESFAQAAWEALVSPLIGLSLLQDWAFGQAKAESGWQVERARLVDENDVTIGAVQVMRKNLPLVGGGLAWINRGPLLVDPKLLPEALTAVARHWQANGCYVRIAPPLTGDFVSDVLKSAGRLGWASAKLDLSPDEASLRKGLKQKWRNVLNKAERQDMEISEDFPLFIERYRAFLAAKGFSTSVTPELLSRLQDFLPEERKLSALLARHNGQVAAGVLLVRYGQTAEYLAGFIEDSGRDLGAGQLLLWRAALAAKEAGGQFFDLGGMDEILTPPGIFHFKDGLGGIAYRLAPEVEACSASPLAQLVRWRVRKVMQ
jgi:lipid II:glycine glycyltransferase (peptidoglycan interpeptide bridge formation enzyme)